MKPKYFVIKQDHLDPLWDEYIEWLTKTYKGTNKWNGQSSTYYGYDGNVNYAGVNGWDEISSFANSPTLITLQQWKEWFINESKVFKEGDRVYHHVYGWGEVKRTDYDETTPYNVLFENYSEAVDWCFHKYELSFTEYTVQGISHERPINYQDYIGEWGFFWDHGDEKYMLSKLIETHDKWFGCEHCSKHDDNRYDNFTPLTPEHKTILKNIINF